MVLETFVLFCEGSWTGSAQHKIDDHYSPYLSQARIVTSHSMKFTKDVVLPYNVIKAIQENFENVLKLRNLVFDIEIVLPVLISKINEVKIDDCKLVKYDIRHTIEGQTWLDWMRNWGYKRSIISCSRIHL